MKIMKLLLILLYGLTSIFYVETLNCLDNKVRSWWYNFISRVYYSKWMIILIFVFFTMNIEIISLKMMMDSIWVFPTRLQIAATSTTQLWFSVLKTPTRAMSWMRKVTSKSSCAMRGTVNVKGVWDNAMQTQMEMIRKTKINVFIKLSYPEKTFWYLLGIHTLGRKVISMQIQMEKIKN